jgi:hypothetical protein
MLWLSQVWPLLITIFEKVDVDRYLRQLASVVSDDPRTAITGAITVAGGLSLAIAHNTPGLITGVLGGTLAANAGFVSKSLMEKWSENRNVKRHDLFFLYSLRKKLRDRGSRRVPSPKESA